MAVRWVGRGMQDISLGGEGNEKEIKRGGVHLQHRAV